MNIIIYGNENGGVTIVIPTQEALTFATIEQIAEKDVPHNAPYWIIDHSKLPMDREFRNAWELPSDIGEPNGFGGESDEFPQVVLENYYKMIGGSNV